MSMEGHTWRTRVLWLAGGWFLPTDGDFDRGACFDGLNAEFDLSVCKADDRIQVVFTTVPTPGCPTAPAHWLCRAGATRMPKAVAEAAAHSQEFMNIIGELADYSERAMERGWFTWGQHDAVAKQLTPVWWWVELLD